MISLSSSDIKYYLESNYHYKIVGIVDVDWLICQPRKTLYKKFKEWHKSVFAPVERIVLYSRKTIDSDILVHIQKCASMVDISNFFILLCCPTVDADYLNEIRKQHSSDDCVFSTLELQITDDMPVGNKNILISLPETFCFSPWAHLEISSQGEFRPCCVYKESIKDSNGRVFNIETDDIQTVYHSQYLSNLRQQFLEGKKPNGCSNCWYKEQYAGDSNRRWFTTHLGLIGQTLTIEQESIKNLVSLDIKLGNLCNFKCRICDPISSSKIADEYSKHFNTPLDVKTINRKGKWSENTNIWQMLGILGPQLVNIDFYGGEPFLIKQQETFLDYLIDNHWADKIRLHYNSNGSSFPTHLFEKWRQFRQVDISFSIDDIGPRFELTRGGDWKEVSANLDMFLESKLSNMILNIFPTVSVQNIYYLEELIDWFETKNFNALDFNLLENPAFFSITKMGKELSTMVLDRLNQIESKKISKYNIKRFVNLIKQHSDSPDLIDQLRAHMLKLDNIRYQNFNLTHPEISKIIYRGK